MPWMTDQFGSPYWQEDGAPSDPGKGVNEPGDTLATPDPAAAPEPAPDPSQSPLGDAGMDTIPTTDEIGAPVGAAADKRTDQTNQIADRYGSVKLDTTAADEARGQQNEALGMQRDIYSKLMSFDPNAAADAAAKRATASSVAMARSAPGGAGARQVAMNMALQNQPAIQSEAAQGAVQQGAQMTQQAAQAAAGFAQTAGGTRAQDLQQAQAQTDTGLSIAQGISQALGRDMTLTSDEAKFLSQAQIELNKLGLDWSQLSEQERASRAQEALQKAGLDAQWKMFKEKQKVGFLDVVGAITGTARSTVETYGSGKKSGLW